MMKKSTCILSIPTLCAMILLMAQGLFGEVRATFTATVSCNVSPEVDLSLDSWNFGLTTWSLKSQGFLTMNIILSVL